jgi:hypothetical protein
MSKDIPGLLLAYVMLFLMLAGLDLLNGNQGVLNESSKITAEVEKQSFESLIIGPGTLNGKTVLILHNLDNASEKIIKIKDERLLSNPDIFEYEVQNDHGQAKVIGVKVNGTTPVQSQPINPTTKKLCYIGIFTIPPLLLYICLKLLQHYL